MRDAFIRTLTQLIPEHPEILLISADLGFGVFNEFIAKYPRHFLNVGVAEQNMSGVAAGIALEGRTVFTYSIGNFPTLRCLEQVRNDICYHRANVKLVCIGAGMSYGSLGISHHATEDLAILRSLPGMLVLSPGDLWEAAEASRWLVEHQGPAYLRLDKSAASLQPRPGEVFEAGKIRTVREGSDVTLAATGGILGEALSAADQLAESGISCRVLSVHTIKPLDTETLAAAARETGGIISVEEHAVDGGLGGAIAETLMETGAIPRFFLRVGLRNTFSSVVGSQEHLRTVYAIDAAAIVRETTARLGLAVPALA
ncbi:MAG TPA: transketolase C-terminal domain-containing protein [Chloroflexota bacterium]|nr:transketolase C-terminal domain-containing protein [Chloroflexota bacterium]